MAYYEQRLVSYLKIKVIYHNDRQWQYHAKSHFLLLTYCDMVQLEMPLVSNQMYVQLYQSRYDDISNGVTIPSNLDLLTVTTLMLQSG